MSGARSKTAAQPDHLPLSSLLAGNVTHPRAGLADPSDDPKRHGQVSFSPILHGPFVGARFWRCLRGPTICRGESPNSTVWFRDWAAGAGKAAVPQHPSALNFFVGRWRPRIPWDFTPRGTRREEVEG